MKVVFYAKEGNSLTSGELLFLFMRPWKTALVFFSLACKKTQLNFMLNFNLFPYLRFLAASFSLTIKLKTPQNEVTMPCYDQASYSRGEAGRR